MSGGRALEWGAVTLGILLLILGGDYGKGFPEFAPDQRAASSFRVVTWNVGQELLEGASGLREEQVSHVVERLKALDADLVLLQEVQDRSQGEAIRAGLGSAWNMKLGGRLGRRRLGMFAPNQAIHVERSVLQGGAGDAMVSLIQLASGPSKVVDLVVACVHGAAFSPQDRNELLGRTRAFLDRYAPSHNRILAGDLNIDLDPDARRDLFSDNSYLDVQTYNAVIQELDGRPGLVDATAGSGPTAEPDRRLDYIFSEPETLAITQAGPWRGQRAPGMDHDPLVLDLVAH